MKLVYSTGRGRNEIKTRCGRCGDVKPLTTVGAYNGMLCVDCSDEKRHETDRERWAIERRSKGED